MSKGIDSEEVYEDDTPELEQADALEDYDAVEDEKQAAKNTEESDKDTEDAQDEVSKKKKIRGIIAELCLYVAIIVVCGVFVPRYVIQRTIVDGKSILASTGMRVGELVRLNRDDIAFDERECVVFGKGDKERMVYFDARTKIHLQNYLDARTDDNKALFVSLKAPYNRMKIGGIELRLRELGKRLNIDKVHPHKFRRTLATVAIDKGMPIEQLQKLLGHQRIDTTLQYAMVKQSNVKIAHRKYIG